MNISKTLLVKNREILINKLISDFINNMNSLEITFNNIIKLEFEKIMKNVLELYKNNNYVDTDNNVKEVLLKTEQLCIEKIKANIFKSCLEIEEDVSDLDLENFSEEYNKKIDLSLENIINLINLDELDGSNEIKFMNVEVKEILDKMLTNLIFEKLYNELMNRNLIIKNVLKETYERYLEMNKNVSKINN